MSRPARHSPSPATGHWQRGLALRQQGALAAACAAFEAAIQAEAGFAPALLALADTLQMARQPAIAIAFYRAFIARIPDNPIAHNNLAVAQHACGRLIAAAASCRRALALDPDYPDAHVNLARSLREHGSTAALAAAATHLRRALQRNPHLAAAYSLLGVISKDQGALTAAEICARTAVIVMPDLADAWANLGVIHQMQDRLEPALACTRTALVLAPAHPAALVNRGTILQRHGDTVRAAALYRQVLRTTPNAALARWNQALLDLLAGRLTEGWQGYAARFAAGITRPERSGGQPEWQGQPLAGRRLRVWREQGVGDELLFASCLPDLLARARTEGGTVVLECEPRLVSLFARAFPAAGCAPEPATGGADADCQIALGSLPRWLRPSLPSFPTRSGFLRSDPERTAAWRKRLAALPPGLRVGIAWRSQRLEGIRHASYTGLTAWEPLLRLPGVTVVSLQYGACETEIQAAEARFATPLHRWADLDLKDDFEGVAALIGNLDLVICGPTAVGELAGALGVPVWRLAWNGDWTTLGSGGRPWFPSMKLLTVPPGATLAESLAPHLRALAAPPGDLKRFSRPI